MKHTNLQFQIDQLRKDKMIVVMETIAIQVFALFVSAYLPQLLLRYYYQNQQLFEQPVLLEYIPVISFAAGALYFLYAVISNIMRWRKIKQLEEEMMFLGDTGCGCGGDCQCGTESNWEELDELDRIVEEAIAESKAEANKAAKKAKSASTSKSASKSSASKKKSTSKTSKSSKAKKAKKSSSKKK